MSRPTEHLKTLERLLQQPLNPERWQALCHVLDQLDTLAPPDQPDPSLIYALIEGSRQRYPAPTSTISVHEPWVEALRSGRWPRWLSLLAPDLDLYGRQLGPTGAKALAQAPQLKAFYRLELDSNAIGAQGAQALAAEPERLSQLVELSLADNALTDLGVEALVTNTSLPALELLSLSDNALGLHAVRQLVTWPLPSLSWLNLSENLLNDQAALMLLEAIGAGAWGALDYLILRDNPISAQGRAKLKALAAQRQGLELDL